MPHREDHGGHRTENSSGSGSPSEAPDPYVEGEANDLQQSDPEVTGLTELVHRSDASLDGITPASERRGLVLAEYREGLAALHDLAAGSQPHSVLRRHLEALEREILGWGGTASE